MPRHRRRRPAVFQLRRQIIIYVGGSQLLYFVHPKSWRDMKFAGILIALVGRSARLSLLNRQPPLDVLRQFTVVGHNECPLRRLGTSQGVFTISKEMKHVEHNTESVPDNPGNGRLSEATAEQGVRVS